MRFRFFLACLFSSLVAHSEQAPPNILLILADDLAWSDPGCYGHPWHETPHIDSLARDGMRFTRGYAPAPICSASRASILTGKTTARLHFEFVTKNDPGFQEIEGETSLATPPFTLNLSLEEKTIPEHLAERNYETAFFGKWHLNSHHRRYLGWSPTHGPGQQGFRVAVEDFGSHPYAWGKTKPAPIGKAGEFPEDSMIDRAGEYLREGRSPFFLMVSLFHVHTPVRTRCRWLIEKYEKKVPADSPNRDRRVTYAAFVEEMDHRVGELLDHLDRAGLRDNTLVLFTSDNGGHPEYTANAPLRGSKWNLYEGGIRVPFLVRWPAKVTASSICRTPVIGYDLPPTFADLAGGRVTNCDGKSIASLFEDPSLTLDRDLVWHFPYYHPERGYRDALERIGIDDFAVSKTRPQSALLNGNDKLLHFYENGRAELYDLSGDPGEQHDLAPGATGRAKELERRLQSHLESMEARLPAAR